LLNTLFEGHNDLILIMTLAITCYFVFHKVVGLQRNHFTFLKNDRKNPFYGFLEQLSTKKSQQDIIHYIHGWQRNLNQLESLKIDVFNHTTVDYEDKLHKMGYIFNQLSWHNDAHHVEVKTVQERLWQSPPLEQQHASPSVLDRLETQYMKKVHLHPLKENRIVGHSLGAQAALRLAERIIMHNPHKPHLWPKRIALIDPAFIKGRFIHFDNKNALELSLALIERLKNQYNIAFECYRSSILTHNPFVGLSNDPLVRLMAFVELKPAYIPFYDIQSRHMASKHYYFESFFSTPQGQRKEHIQHAQTTNELTKSYQDLYFKQSCSGLSDQPHRMIFSSTSFRQKK